MERFEVVKEIGSGNFGVARLLRNKETKELVAVKYIERGPKIDENVQREIINHRSLRHPNIVRFKEVCLTPSHLAIVMEYAAGGELFERICNAGRFSEDEARFFFQQLICGVSYCHNMEICHRDLKLENTLLDGSPTPKLKICDFGYSKVRNPSSNSNYGFQTCVCLRSQYLNVYTYRHRMSACVGITFNTQVYVRMRTRTHTERERERERERFCWQSAILHSQPKSTVGTPAYIAPEVLSRKEYDGKIADVWSCGVTLYVMLVGAYPFEDPQDPRNFRKTISRILSVQYSIPDYVHISSDCRQLLARIFVANPAKRITISEIKRHPWFLKNMPKDLLESSETTYNHDDPSERLQSIPEITRIISEAKVPGVKMPNTGGYPDELDLDVEADIDVETSGDFVCAV